MDAIYIRNRVLALFKEDYYEVSEKVETNQYETLDALLEIALEKELIEEHMAAKDQFISHLMDLFRNETIWSE